MPFQISVQVFFIEIIKHHFCNHNLINQTKKQRIIIHKGRIELKWFNSFELSTDLPT